jgi:xanthine dehydrogenase molybdopterin-binding subunit B
MDACCCCCTPSPQVTVKCRRLGGAFGGKALHATKVATAAAVAAAVTKTQVRLCFVLDMQLSLRVSKNVSCWHDNIGSTRSGMLCCSFVGQVRLVTTRQQDFRMFGGRAEKHIEYSVGWDDDGRITALDIATVIQG